MGDGAIESYSQGRNPMVTVPFYFADAGLRKILSPNYSSSGGYPYQRPVKEHTIAIIPERLMFDATTQTLANRLNSNGGNWTIETPDPATPGSFLAPRALTVKEGRLFDLTLWGWRVNFSAPSFGFRHEDGGREVDNIDVMFMIDETKPDDHMLFTLGDPYLAGIDIEGSSS
jgi:hypothetical protein